MAPAGSRLYFFSHHCCSYLLHHATATDPDTATATATAIATATVAGSPWAGYAVCMATVGLLVGPVVSATDADARFQAVYVLIFIGAAWGGGPWVVRHGGWGMGMAWWGGAWAGETCVWLAWVGCEACHVCGMGVRVAWV